MSGKTVTDHRTGSVWIRPLWGQGAPAKRPRNKLPRGRYVYAWFSDDSPFPFYIGKGADSRAWARHEDQDGRAMWCQTMRATAKGFRVEVIRDNLTDEGALLVESCLMAFTRLLGGVLANQADGLSRQEKPPLELAVGVSAPQTSEDAPDGPIIPETASDAPENSAP